MNNLNILFKGNETHLVQTYGNSCKQLYYYDASDELKRKIIKNDSEIMACIFYSIKYDEDYEIEMAKCNFIISLEAKMKLLYKSIARNDMFTFTKYLEYYDGKENIIEKIIFNSVSEDTTFKMLSVALEKYSNFITDLCYKSSRAKKYDKIIDLLNINMEVKNDEDMCYLCYSDTEQYNIIYGICLCKFKIHYNCAIKNIRINGIICKTCNTLINKNKEFVSNNAPYHCKIFFPFAGVFPIPLMNGSFEICHDLIRKIRYSVEFLQYDNLKLILSKDIDNITKINAKKIITDPYIGYFCNGFYVIRSHMPSGAKRKLNPRLYRMIEILITDNFSNI
jgi:hypothetical protein